MATTVFQCLKKELNKAWIKDEELNTSVKILTKLQLTLQEEAVAKAKSTPVAAVAKMTKTAPMAPVVPVKSIDRDLEAGNN